MSEPVATLSASAPRRLLAMGMLGLLGGLLIYLGLATPPASPLWQGFLVVFGFIVLVLTDKLRRATALEIIYGDGMLADSSGAELCRIDMIDRVERGTFAFKPSNGFVVILKAKGKRHWAPGLWWRMGRRIGVGGVTSAAQSKFMAEAIAFDLAARNRAD